MGGSKLYLNYNWSSNRFYFGICLELKKVVVCVRCFKLIDLLVEVSVIFSSCSNCHSR